jgi:hypothetical protein
MDAIMVRAAIVLDFETANTKIELKVVGAHVYAEHWATEILTGSKQMAYEFDTSRSSGRNGNGQR